MSRIVQGDNKITQKYSTFHKGVDIGWIGGNNDNVLAHSDGVVVQVITGRLNDRNATGNNSYGNYIKIKHYNGYYTLYGHLSLVYVNIGDVVKKGQLIGYMGNSGNASAKHLHFEIRDPKDDRINPAAYINDDLPGTKILYQVYDLVKKKWLPNVELNTNDYAGNFGNSIGALYIDNLVYRTHDLNKKRWLPFVNGRTDFAGNKTPVDGVQIRNVTYRVHLKNGSWLAWVSKVDNTNSGYAGIYGKEIDAIQIKTSEN